MGFREVGIPLDHGQGFVPQHLGALQQAGTIHGEIRGCGVAQVVKVSDVCTAYRVVPGIPDTVALDVRVCWEKQVCLKMTHTRACCLSKTSAEPVRGTVRRSPFLVWWKVSVPRLRSTSGQRGERSSC
jgi:hypothetical protein